MSRIIIRVLLFSFLIPFFSDAQVNKTDSIHNLYLKEKNDSLRIRYHLEYLYNIIGNGERIGTDAEIASVRKELEEFPLASLLPVFYYYEGTWNYTKTEYLKSIISFERSLKTFQPDAEKDHYGFSSGNVYVSLGLSYSMINDWENAQIDYQKAIKAYEKANDSSGISLAYLNTAYIFSDGGDWNNAALTLKKGISYIVANKQADVPIAIYASLSEAYSRLNRMNEAKLYLEKADSLLQLTPSNSAKTFYFFAKAENDLSAKKYSEAIKANTKSLFYARQWGDSSFAEYALGNLGRAYQAMGRLDDAVAAFTECNKIAVVNNYLPQRKIVLKQLFQLYKENGQPGKALTAAMELFTISDSIAIVQNNNRRIIMDAVFESGNQEERISMLEQEKELQQMRIRQKNTFNYILIAGIITLLVISLLSYRNHKQKQKLQLQRIMDLEKDKQLVAVDSLLQGQEEERSRLSRDLHDGLGGLLSGIKFSLSNMKENLIITPDNMAVFERSLDMIDYSITELRRVAHNMMPEMLIKFGLDEALKEYCNTINTAKLTEIKYQSLGMNDRVDKSTEIIIYRIVQELLNNIIKHAAATRVFVQLIREERRLNLLVEDNGKGFDPSLLENSRGAGWTNIRARVKYLKGEVDIHSDPGKGTLVNIEFNV